MKAMRGIHPGLSAVLQTMSPVAAGALMRDVILSTYSQFADLELVAQYGEQLASGAPLNHIDRRLLHALYEQLEAAEMNNEEADGNEADRERLFKQGRYAYALSLAAGTIDSDALDSFVYDMAHAFDDPDAFWEGLYRKVSGA